ncbi:MAG: hypothetical protein HFE57_10020 [Firmicutes bacterium]|jgi:hypothetical protein|nr:hypothetical protein [Bacillota bacterium]
MESIPITNYLYTAIISGYYSVDDCRKWADRIILNNEVDNIDIWIFDVAFSTNEEQLFDAILEQKIQEVFDENTTYSKADAIVGYYYLLYKEQKMSALELINKITDEDDNSYEGNLYSNERFCKTMFSVGESFKNCRTNREKEKVCAECLKKIEDLFISVSTIALQQQAILKSYLM